MVPAMFRIPLLGVRYYSKSSLRSLVTGAAALPHRVSGLATSDLKPSVLTLLQLYNQRVASGRLKDDPYQRKILSSMNELYTSLQNYHPPIPGQAPSGWMSWFKEPPTIPHGIYLYGDVGCGKTMLMDLFYQTIPPHLTKKRLHFHQFMQELHKRVHQMKKTHHEDLVIPSLANELAHESTVLCFDEFQVTDVADAMLLRRLIDLALREDHGLVLFATSNRAPDELYINGVQRESFVPCIEEIKSKTHVIYMRSPTDYRKVARPMTHVYYSPDGSYAASAKEREDHVNSWYSFFSQNHEVETQVPVTIWGRKVIIPRCSPPYVAQFTFKELCGQPYAAGDYLELASDFSAFIVTDIPFLSIESRDEVRRFITFLDAAYDSHCRLAVTGAAPFEHIFVEPEDIGKTAYELSETAKNKLVEEEMNYDNDPLVQEHGFDPVIADKASIFAKVDEERFAFARALSRLKQMSSVDWVERDS